MSTVPQPPDWVPRQLADGLVIPAHPLALAAAATAYRHRRTTQLHEGRLAVTVAHRDLLALPPHCPTEPSDSS